MNKERCIGCRVCIVACPFGAMSFDTEQHVACKCDLCGGAPKCVEICKICNPPGALKWIKAKDSPLSSEKRMRAIRKLASPKGVTS